MAGEASFAESLEFNPFRNSAIASMEMRLGALENTVKQLADALADMKRMAHYHGGMNIK